MSFGSKSLPAPTAAQKQRWDDAGWRGCVAATLGGHGGPLEMHHLKSGNLRMGHWWTVCLCKNHHARAAWLTKVFGNEVLMEWQDRLLGYNTPRTRERIRRNGPPTARPTKRIGSMTTAATRKGKTVGRKSQCTAASNAFPRSAARAAEVSSDRDPGDEQ